VDFTCILSDGLLLLTQLLRYGTVRYLSNADEGLMHCFINNPNLNFFPDNSSGSKLGRGFPLGRDLRFSTILKWRKPCLWKDNRRSSRGRQEKKGPTSGSGRCSAAQERPRCGRPAF
jgi:hypothetical protein